MPSDWTSSELLRNIAAFCFGGVGGAFLTNYFTNKRSRIQPVRKKATVSFVDLPEILRGNGAKIVVGNPANVKPGEDWQSALAHFNNIAVITIELTNSGNKDIDQFKIGLNFPETTKAIKFQGEGDDRYHVAKCKQEVSIVKPVSELDIHMKPFNRKNTYTLTIIADTEDRSIKNKIKLSTVDSVEIIDVDAKQISTNKIFNYATIGLTLLLGLMGFFYSKLDDQRFELQRARQDALIKQQEIVLDSLKAKNDAAFERLLRKIDTLNSTSEKLNR